MRTERLYLQDMLDAVAEIAEFTQTATLDSFIQSKLLQRAVSQSLSTLGEAARCISPELKARHPLVPWPQIVAFRNILVHAYFGLNPARVWNAATEDAPDLGRQIASILRSEFPDA